MTTSPTSSESGRPLHEFRRQEPGGPGHRPARRQHRIRVGLPDQQPPDPHRGPSVRASLSRLHGAARQRQGRAPRHTRVAGRCTAPGPGTVAARRPARGAPFGLRPVHRTPAGRGGKRAVRRGRLSGPCAAGRIGQIPGARPAGQQADRRPGQPRVQHEVGIARPHHHLRAASRAGRREGPLEGDLRHGPVRPRWLPHGSAGPATDRRRNQQRGGRIRGQGPRRSRIPPDPRRELRTDGGGAAGRPARSEPRPSAAFGGLPAGAHQRLRRLREELHLGAAAVRVPGQRTRRSPPPAAHPSGDLGGSRSPAGRCGGLGQEPDRPRGRTARHRGGLAGTAPRAPGAGRGGRRPDHRRDRRGGVRGDQLRARGDRSQRNQPRSARTAPPAPAHGPLPRGHHGPARLSASRLAAGGRPGPGARTLRQGRRTAGRGVPAARHQERTGDPGTHRDPSPGHGPHARGLRQPPDRGAPGRAGDRAQGQGGAVLHPRDDGSAVRGRADRLAAEPA